MVYSCRPNKNRDVGTVADSQTHTPPLSQTHTPRKCHEQTHTLVTSSCIPLRLPHSHPCEDQMHTPHAYIMSRVQCSVRSIATHFLRFWSSAAKFARQSGEKTAQKHLCQSCSSSFQKKRAVYFIFSYFGGVCDCSSQGYASARHQGMHLLVAFPRGMSLGAGGVCNCSSQGYESGSRRL